jgi:hypothetical protein
MAYIKSILEEEYQRLVKLKKKYSAMLADYPTGTISIKERNEKKYLYIAQRLGKKIKFTYIAPLENEKAQKKIELISERKKIEKKLKKVKMNCNEVKRAMK